MELAPERVAPHDIEHLVVLGHPGARSFNRLVAETYCAAVEDCGQRATLRDLYAMNFDPRLKDSERPDKEGFSPAPEVAAELELLRRCAVVTLVYPLWFGMPPAIIKGYIDRVLGAGFPASAITHGAPNPLLQGKHLVILSSSALTRPWLEERGQWLSLRQAFDLYLTDAFAFADSAHVHFDAIVPQAAPQLLDQCLEQVVAQARKTCSAVLSERHARQMHHRLHPSALETPNRS